MSRRARALRRLEERRGRELDKEDVDLLCGLAALRLTSVTALPGQPGLETVSSTYYERLTSLVEKLLFARDHWAEQA
jgi:hypothetical protein